MKKMLLILSFTTLLFAQKRILIDEKYNDWDEVSTFCEDPTGDNLNGTFDFKTLWVTNDDDYIYIRIQTTENIILVNSNYLTIYIDTDNDANTGKSINGIGAELEYTLGTRKGRCYSAIDTSINNNDIGFIGAPTFSGNDFEFVINKNSQLSGVPLFSGSTIKILLVAYANSSFDSYFDRTPDLGGYEYIFKTNKFDPVPSYSIIKQNEKNLRVMSYNIKRDEITKPESTTEFNHIFRAIDPEIIGLCEAYESSSQQIADRIEFFIPSGEGEKWYNKKEGAYDIVLVSRFPIKKSFTIHSEIGHDASGAFLLDLRPKYDSDILVIVAHPKCCGGNESDKKRQNQFDAIIAFIRDAVNSGGKLTISRDTPILIMGDMNLVGDCRQYETLITGDIFDNEKYGEDFKPDWDGSILDDAIPYTANTGMTYTTNMGGFPPGRLDYVVYSGSVMKAVNSYIFDSAKLSDEELSQFGLSRADSEVSDHLPVVVDFNINVSPDNKK